MPRVKIKLAWFTLFLLKTKVRMYITEKYPCNDKNSLGLRAGHLRVLPRKYKKPVILKIKNLQILRLGFRLRIEINNQKKFTLNNN